jgi:flagellar M-ring protein FliF
MDFLNKALAQLGDLFRSMTPGARITAGLLLVVVIVSLGYLFRYQVSGPDEYLMYAEAIDTKYLPAMEAAFAQKNLTSYTVDGNRIRIPRGQRAAYNAALVEAKALPPNFGTALNKAQDSANIFESPEQRRQRMKISLQEELSLIIRSMKGVENAYVLYDTDTKSGLNLNHEKTTTATVGVKPQGSEQLDAERVSSIRQCVAGAIAGMKAENVTVIDLNGGRPYHGDSDGGGMAGENTYAAVKEMYERALKSKILNAVPIPNLAVEVSVVLDPLRSSHSDTVKLEPKTVPYYIEEKGETENREGGGGAGGRPGYAVNANGPTALATAAGKGPRDERENTQRKEQSTPLSTDHTRKETVGLTPKSAKATVGIPSGYYEKVWRERNPAKEGEEAKTPDQAALDQIREEVSKDVRKHVATLLPAAESAADAAELVTITTFQDIRPGEIPAPSASQKAMIWLGQNWSTLGMVGLALVSLAILRSMVRGSPPHKETGSMSLRVADEPESATGAPPAPGETPEMKVARRLRRIVGSGPSLRDELSELVKEDPDSAANILRAWIGNAG